MNIRYLIVCFCLVLCACKKTDINTKSSFSFKLNGVQYWKTSVDSSFIIASSLGYYLYSAPIEHQDRYAIYHTNYDSRITNDSVLQVKSYSYLFLTSPGNTYLVFYNWAGNLIDGYSLRSTTDNYSITITKIENGYVSGYFNATLSTDFIITNGVFNNLRIKRY